MKARTVLLLLLAGLGAQAPADDTARLAALLAPALEHGGTVTIPPGDYQVDGASPLTIGSHLTVSAYGGSNVPASLVYDHNRDLDRNFLLGAQVTGQLEEGTRVGVSYVNRRIEQIPGRLRSIWEESEAKGLPANSIADRMAQKLIGRG